MQFYKNIFDCESLIHNVLQLGLQYSVYQNNSNPNLACNNAEYIRQIRLFFTPLLSSFIYLSNDMLYVWFSWTMKEYCFDKNIP